MKFVLTLLAVAMLSSAAFSQNNQGPAPSPGATVKQDFGPSSIELSYSRPGVKGRKIFGELVPFDKVWRTGANGATTITFGSDVTIGDKKVAAGKYGLLTIPGQSEWTVIITKSLKVTNAEAYKEAEDVVRLKVKPMDLPFPIETFMIVFDDIKPDSLKTVILWDKTAVPFEIAVAKK